MNRRNLIKTGITSLGLSLFGAKAGLAGITKDKPLEAPVGVTEKKDLAVGSRLWRVSIYSDFYYIRPIVIVSKEEFLKHIPWMTTSHNNILFFKHIDNGEYNYDISNRKIYNTRQDAYDAALFKCDQKLKKFAFEFERLKKLQ